MKKIVNISVWSLMLFILVLSCKKDDPAATNALIGNWKFVSFAYTGCTDPTNNFIETCDTDCGTLSITATGWSFTQPGVATESGTYTVSGSTITTTPTSGTPTTSTYAITGTTLTFTEAASDGCSSVTTWTKI